MFDLENIIKELNYLKTQLSGLKLQLGILLEDEDFPDNFVKDEELASEVATLNSEIASTNTSIINLTNTINDELDLLKEEDKLLWAEKVKYLYTKDFLTGEVSFVTSSSFPIYNLEIDDISANTEVTIGSNIYPNVAYTNDGRYEKEPITFTLPVNSTVYIYITLEGEIEVSETNTTTGVPLYQVTTDESKIIEDGIVDLRPINDYVFFVGGKMVLGEDAESGNEAVRYQQMLGALELKAGKNGNALETFEVADGTIGKQAVNFEQLDVQKQRIDGVEGAAGFDNFANVSVATAAYDAAIADGGVDETVKYPDGRTIYIEDIKTFYKWDSTNTGVWATDTGREALQKTDDLNDADQTKVAEVSVVTELETKLVKSTVKQIIDIESSVGYIDLNGDLQTTSGFVYKVIDLSTIDLNEEQLFATFGAQGSSMVHIAYFTSDVLTSANYLGRDVQDDIVVSEQRYNTPMTIIDTATHAVISSVDSYDLILRKNPTAESIVNESVESSNNYTREYANNLIGYTQENKVLDLDFVNSYYIQESSHEPVFLSGYRYTVIDLSTIVNKETVLLDFGTQGGSLSILSYYTSQTLNDTNHISTEVTGGVNAQVTNYNPTIPETANYMVVCSESSFDISCTAEIIKPSEIKAIPYLYSANLVGNIYQGLISNPYNTEAKSLQKRSSLLLNLPDNSNAFIQIYGQSNADGRIAYADAPAWFTSSNGIMEDFMMWNRITGRFEPYQMGYNTGADDNEDTRHGFEIYFAKKWLDANPGKKLYCYKKTKGGTPIYGDSGSTASWNAKTEDITGGKRELCTEAIAELKVLIQYCLDKSIDINPIGILYHQGESDADLGSTGITPYPQNLKNLFSWFRGLLNTPNLPIINGQIANAYSANYALINDIFSDVNVLDENFLTVNMIGQATQDGIHYTQAAIEYMAGEMYSYFQNF